STGARGGGAGGAVLGGPGGGGGRGGGGQVGGGRGGGGGRGRGGGGGPPAVPLAAGLRQGLHRGAGADERGVRHRLRGGEHVPAARGRRGACRLRPALESAAHGQPARHPGPVAHGRVRFRRLRHGRAAR